MIIFNNHYITIIYYSVPNMSLMIFSCSPLQNHVLTFDYDTIFVANGYEMSATTFIALEKP